MASKIPTMQVPPVWPTCLLTINGNEESIALSAERLASTACMAYLPAGNEVSIALATERLANANSNYYLIF